MLSRKWLLENRISFTPEFKVISESHILMTMMLEKNRVKQSFVKMIDSTQMDQLDTVIDHALAEVIETYYSDKPVNNIQHVPTKPVEAPLEGVEADVYSEEDSIELPQQGTKSVPGTQKTSTSEVTYTVPEGYTELSGRIVDIVKGNLEGEDGNNFEVYCLSVVTLDEEEEAIFVLKSDVVTLDSFESLVNEKVQCLCYLENDLKMVKSINYVDRIQA